MSTTLFTDGASRGNPGPGGWAAVLVFDEKPSLERFDGTKADCRKIEMSTARDTKGAYVLELGGREDMTTNNQMEMKAAVEGLSRTSEGEDVTVFTDSSYLINGITKWVAGWKRNGWQTKTKEDVQNRDLWERLDGLTKARTVKWKYVGGHVGIVGNERCDHIATDLADGNKLKLYDGPLAGYDLPNILDVSQDSASAGKKKSDRSHSQAKAYSYVSAVGGVIEVHHSWSECEKRVKGVRGAKFKKSLNAEGEKRIIEEFEAI